MTYTDAPLGMSQEKYNLSIRRSIRCHNCNVDVYPFIRSAPVEIDDLRRHHEFNCSVAKNYQRDLAELLRRCRNLYPLGPLCRRQQCIILGGC